MHAKEAIEMAVVEHVTFRLVPWDDRDFTAAFERAAGLLRGQGIDLHTPAGSLQLQHQIRNEGYPNATAWCERNVDEALSHHARCVVSRDGSRPEPLR
jgi:hypothetical protein